ncbi:MAG: C39 family peptidase [Planctomycetes bacterium]|nr:C39 family peptidase [Planctomycetota bacterium]MCC7169880.1 C39 family peptidase [Planctomycetota bacterium]
MIGLIGSVLFLAGLVAKGDAMDPVRPFVHLLVRQDQPKLDADGVGEVVVAAAPFNEVLLSWNVDVPVGGGFVVDARVRANQEDGSPGPWSPWLRFGRGGADVATDAVTSFDGGTVDVDVFRGKTRFSAIQARVETAGVEPVRVARWAFCLSDTSAERGSSMACWAAAPHPGRRFAVPYRSQRDEDPALASRVCSPTCVTMVLGYRGVETTTAEVARRAFDAEHDVYGNWPNAIQAAYSLGVPGYLTRIADVHGARFMVGGGQPLIVSVGFENGALRGSPMRSTKGHLIVLTGVDANGDFFANDPAAENAERGQCVYRAEDLERVWIQRNGVAYVLLERPQQAER